MPVLMGLDIGSNSVGSAWIDTDARLIDMGVSVFPAGVDETDTKRGSPIGRKRREKRSQRRNIARRAQSKRLLRRILTQYLLLPTTHEELKALFDMNPWELRRKGLREALAPYEFGRILVHLRQRRGAIGIEVAETTSKDGDDRNSDQDEMKVKAAIDHTRKEMKQYGAATFGQFIADLMDRRRKPLEGKLGHYYCDPVRNRRDTFEFHADRNLIRSEFSQLWDTQKSFSSTLSKILTDELKLKLDDPKEDDVWRHKGVLFGQRRTYWDSGTLGHCDLEPTDHRCSIADMYAQEFRILETVNNIRIQKRGEDWLPLKDADRTKVIDVLRKQKTGSVATIRKAIGIHKKEIKDFYALNIERDSEREINTDWFYREIIVGVFTEETWKSMSQQQKDSVNSAILKHDPDNTEHEALLRKGACKWWNLSIETADHFIATWKARPKLDRRVNLSRRAIINLLPYMRQGFDVTRSKQMFAEDDTNGATNEQRQRYAGFADSLTKADRHYLKKHPDLLPPAPMLANPVVRKAIHEVRRHVIAYMRKYGRKPDRIVIELARSATQTEKVRNRILSSNRKREKERIAIEEEFKDYVRPDNPIHRIVDRVRLWREQKLCSAYSDTIIGEDMVVNGTDLEIDHIVPMSRSQDNSFNNKVLCLRGENRDKRNLTAKEWLTGKGAFAQMEQRLQHLRDDNPRKWDNLHRDAQSREEWANSQLTDTAYASVEVVSYLRDALYGGTLEMGSKGTRQRRIFTTKGVYTAMLRKDWQLFRTSNKDTPEKIKEQGREEATATKEKDRTDHRHHAIDAVIIALTGPDTIQSVARRAEGAEFYHERTGFWSHRDPLQPPWGDVDEFRRQVLERAYGNNHIKDPAGHEQSPIPAIVVSHRSIKRRLLGRLHKDTQYGPVFGHDGNRTKKRVTIRQPIYENSQSYLKPAHLRMPTAELREDAIKRITKELVDNGVNRSDAKQRATTIVDRTDYKVRMIDPDPSKTGIVRDFDLRKTLRNALAERGLDPDHYTEKQLKEILEHTGPLRHASGMPIKNVVLLWSNNDPVEYLRYKYDFTEGRMKAEENERTLRIYDSQNNHHIEIREYVYESKGQSIKKWNGKVITASEAYCRNANRYRELKRLKVPSGHQWMKLTRNEKARFKSIIAETNKRNSIVDRNDNDNGRFIMSLSEGETVYMRHPTTDKPGYYVVFKLDKPDKIHFINHWDARSSKIHKDDDGQQIPDSQREPIPVTASKLMELGVEKNLPPYKVRVCPIGSITRLIGD